MRLGASRVLRIVDKAFSTDTGRQRNANEDALFVRARSRGPPTGWRCASGRSPRKRRPRLRRIFPTSRGAGAGEKIAARTGRFTISTERPLEGGVGTTITRRSSTPGEEVGIGSATARYGCAAASGRLTRVLAGRGDAAQGTAQRGAGRGPPAALDLTRAPVPRNRLDVDVHTVPAARGRLPANARRLTTRSTKTGERLLSAPPRWKRP